MTKHDFEKHPLAVGQVWKTRDGDEVTLVWDYDAEEELGYPWEDETGRWSWLKDGYEWEYENRSSRDNDLVELIYDPNIVETLPEYYPNFSRNEILEAIIADKPILFRIDDTMEWQEVKDNNWVLKMIGEETKYFFKVKPKVKELFMIYNVYSAKGQMKTRLQDEELETGDTQVKYTFEDDLLISTEVVTAGTL